MRDREKGSSEGDENKRQNIVYPNDCFSVMPLDKTRNLSIVRLHCLTYCPSHSTAEGTDTNMEK